MIPSRTRGLLIHLLQKQLLCHSQLASYPHFKWLSSSFKWLSICQASETWICVITLCSPLTLATLLFLLFTFPQATNEANFPTYSEATAHLNCARKNKKIKNHPQLWSHTCPAFSYLHCSVCHRLHIYVGLHWGFTTKNKTKTNEQNKTPRKN